MKKLLILMVVVWLVMVVGTAWGQTTQPEPPNDMGSECDYVALATNEAKKLATATTLDEIVAFQNKLAVDLATCNGLYFYGDSNRAIGPIVIPQGIYRVTALTETSIAVDVIAIVGECEGTGYGSTIISELEFDAAIREEVFFFTGEQGCTALIEISNTSEAWSLWFTPIATS